jgi:hypothetical protein
LKQKIELNINEYDLAVVKDCIEQDDFSIFTESEFCKDILDQILEQIKPIKYEIKN